jgi:hypothetical protein
MLPDREIGILTSTVLGAVELAADERRSEGYERLLTGLRRAEHARRSGDPWAPELIARYRAALENYVHRYGGEVCQPFGV